MPPEAEATIGATMGRSQVAVMDFSSGEWTYMLALLVGLGLWEGVLTL